MRMRHVIPLTLYALTVLLAILTSISYHNARRSLNRTFPGLDQAPVREVGGLARRSASGVHLAWFFTFYQRSDTSSRSSYCEEAQAWVSLSGQVPETFPLGPGMSEWIRCLREDTGVGRGA